jgi:hypothetical protein
MMLPAPNRGLAAFVLKYRLMLTPRESIRQPTRRFVPFIVNCE